MRVLMRVPMRVLMHVPIRDRGRGLAGEVRIARGGDARDAGQLHRTSKLVDQDRDRAGRAVAAGGRRAVEHWPADRDRIGARRDRLEHVDAAWRGATQ